LLDALLLTDNTHAGKQRIVAPAARPAQQMPSPGIATDNKQSQFVTLGKLKLPSDLAWLVQEQDMQATGVLQLMKLAKQVKQRLSDVVGATKKYLESLKGRELYAYLRALLHTNKDFGQRAEKAASDEFVQQQQNYLQEKAAAFSGQTFQSRDAKLMVTVDASGMLMQERAGQRTARPMCQSFLDAIAAGRLLARRDAFI
jgi:hypothetical protein